MASCKKRTLKYIIKKCDFFRRINQIRKQLNNERLKKYYVALFYVQKANQSIPLLHLVTNHFITMRIRIHFSKYMRFLMCRDDSALIS